MFSQFEAPFPEEWRALGFIDWFSFWNAYIELPEEDQESWLKEKFSLLPGKEEIIQARDAIIMLKDFHKEHEGSGSSEDTPTYSPPSAEFDRIDSAFWKLS